jgi:hypothetical protein
MTSTGTSLLLSQSIYLVSKLHISADSAHVHYRLIVALTEYVCMISPGVHEGTYRFVYS